MSKTNSIYRAISLLTAAGLFASLCSCADEVEPAEVSETTTRGWISHQTGAGVHLVTSNAISQLLLQLLLITNT